jgi:hemerythrin-like domain-containing protein
MNAIDLLTKDHREVQRLLEQGDDTTERAVKTRPELLQRIVDELARLAPDDETWGAKFTVMKENLEHHIEEEEGEMFPKARQVMDDDELEELGRLMEARREDLRA